ncbi:hypothetical protein GGH12_001352 [Coemansia sp. RSA 1822]|nr:hypothetical protein LPJ76_005182 [Coemansia sp. RSA 638]KAJ2123645.1 hypothetical protein IW147_002394 [Coemansia sp. RSA 720]KAJ2538194.1 hypothetical protein GGF49_006063 [Coemansia sp. RSA 1853]KAJ2565557.1 hypothetical protein GGH12_001352 [Coemansia sp. RSA 1822]
MTGIDGDPYATVKYISNGVDTCDRGTIIDAVYEAIAPLQPTRLIIVMNVREALCPGLADNTIVETMIYNLNWFNPHVLFHELGHGLSFQHPAACECYANKVKVMMSNNCTSVNGDDFQNMGVISHDQPWFKSDNVTNVNTEVKGTMEYSSYNRLSSDWPMLKEVNVLDVSGSGTYKIYNSETASIENNTAVLRIPLNPPIKISNDMVSENVTYHTHYYVDFTQRRPNTDEGGVNNFVVVRTAPDYRARRSHVTRFMAALSKDDTEFETSFYDNYREIKIDIQNIDSTGTTLDISFPSDYGPSEKVNQCYYSAIIEPEYAVTVNDNYVCRGYSDGILLTGSFNSTHCLIYYSEPGYMIPLPKLEFLHCLDTPKWITTEESTMQEGFEVWGEKNMHVCKLTYEGVVYQGRGAFDECCFFYEGGKDCIWGNDDTLYLSWIS